MLWRITLVMHCNFDIIMKVVKRRLFLLTNKTRPDNMSQMHYNEHGLWNVLYKTHILLLHQSHTWKRFEDLPQETLYREMTGVLSIAVFSILWILIYCHGFLMHLQASRAIINTVFFSYLGKSKQVWFILAGRRLFAAIEAHKYLHGLTKAFWLGGQIKHTGNINKGMPTSLPL